MAGNGLDAIVKWAAVASVAPFAPPQPVNRSDEERAYQAGGLSKLTFERLNAIMESLGISRVPPQKSTDYRQQTDNAVIARKIITGQIILLLKHAGPLTASELHYCCGGGKHSLYETIDSLLSRELIKKCTVLRPAEKRKVRISRPGFKIIQ